MQPGGETSTMEIMEISQKYEETRAQPPELEHEHEKTVYEPALASAFATAEIPSDIQGYVSSSDASSRHSGGAGDLFLDNDEYHDHNQLSTTSSRSSISSLPASVVVHPREERGMAKGNRFPSTISSMIGTDIGVDERESGSKYVRSDGRQTIRSKKRLGTNQNYPFRHPSSVKAMQLHTEDEYDDDEDYNEGAYFASPSRVRGPHYRGSPSSVRSTGSSPHKRSALHNRAGSTPRKESNVTKEYPLVLLHCNLLPPSLSLPAGIRTPSLAALQEALPTKYWKRWKLLEEKTVGSGLVRDRGVLISHPQEMYDVLEERLLESLELQRPRLRNGHYLGPDEELDSDDNGEKRSTAETEGIFEVDDEKDGDECPDCGHRVIHNEDSPRKWEVKIYAANGLMKAGAWAAAWREMEKVDVQIGLWLPSSVRRDLERKLLELEQVTAEESRPVQDELKDILANEETLLTQEEIDGLAEMERSETLERKENLPKEDPYEYPASRHHHYPNPAQDIDLRTLLVNYFRLLASDKRNVAIGILSILILFLAIGGARTSVAIQPPVTTLVPPPMYGVSHAPSVGIHSSHAPTSVSTNRDNAIELPTVSASVENGEDDSFTPSSTIVDIKESTQETILPSEPDMENREPDIDLAQHEEDKIVTEEVPAAESVTDEPDIEP